MSDHGDPREAENILSPQNGAVPQSNGPVSESGVGSLAQDTKALAVAETPIPRDGDNGRFEAATVVSSEDEAQTPALSFPVVAFGASAGGLQALKEILQNLTPDTGMAFVIITHLAPDQKSYLAEIAAH